MAEPPHTTPTFTSRHVAIGDARLHLTLAGSGPGLIFLHGFPEFGQIWTHQMRTLAARFSCIAPDQRGFGFSDAPRAQDAFKLPRLACDVRDLALALGHERIFLIGHDWGGIVAWQVCEMFPNLIDRCVVFNAPPLAFLERALWSDQSQRERSAYIYALRAEGAATAIAALPPEAQWTMFYGRDRGLSRHDEATRQSLLRAWARPGAWEAMVNWYRALEINLPGLEAPLRPAAPAPALAIACAALLVWGDDDAVFAESCLEGLTAACPSISLRRLQGVGHAAFREQPDLCLQMVQSFFGR